MWPRVGAQAEAGLKSTLKEPEFLQGVQDPFIPADTLKVQDKQVTLQVVETEAEPKTVIRYIVTPAQASAQVAAGSSQ